MRIGRIAISPVAAWLVGILLMATAARLHGVAFGLPSLYDADEGIFVLTSLKLLLHRTLNPGWFGHPGSTTIYCLALIELMILLTGWLSGRFPNAGALADAVYAHPTVIFLPGRLFIVGCGVLCVLLTFLVARRLFGARTGLVAAALLAVNPLHIEYSQIIRTDVHTSVFMLLCALWSLGIVRRGRLIDYLLAGAAIGFATATKWPAGTIVACPVAACLLRAIREPEDAARQARFLAAGMLASLASLFVASPYLLLDLPTVLSDFGGERQPAHLGANGGGFLENASWYVSRPLRDALGPLGLVLAAAGLAIGAWRNRAMLVVVAGTLLFLAAICTQRLIWPRWIVPLLPFVSIFAAAAVTECGRLARAHVGDRWRTPADMLMLGAVAIPMALAARAGATERLHDTRGLATAWIWQHVPPGRTVFVEHFAFDLLAHGPMLFPLGAAGCLDAAAVLKSRIPVSTVSALRQGSSIVNLGTIDARRIATCQSDYMVLSYYDRYLAEAGRFPREVAVYRYFLRHGRIEATFAPVAGRIGGPVVRVVRMTG